MIGLRLCPRLVCWQGHWFEAMKLVAQGDAAATAGQYMLPSILLCKQRRQVQVSALCTMADAAGVLVQRVPTVCCYCWLPLW